VLSTCLPTPGLASHLLPLQVHWVLPRGTWCPPCGLAPGPASVLSCPVALLPSCIFLCALQGRVCGLCGNFDDIAINDFTTRSQSVVGNALEFGNSWKFSPSCPDALVPKDPCTTNPYRKSWAQKQCSIINSATFANCRSQVGPREAQGLGVVGRGQRDLWLPPFFWVGTECDWVGHIGL
jgi:hypothetical protein